MCAPISRRSFVGLVPENAGYRHEDEGPDDMPAHIKAALTQTQLVIPVDDGRLVLGTWQGIYLFEHRAAPHQREIVLHLHRRMKVSDRFSQVLSDRSARSVGGYRSSGDPGLGSETDELG